jgi:hypothetical protein
VAGSVEPAVAVARPRPIALGVWIGMAAALPVAALIRASIPPAMQPVLDPALALVLLAAFQQAVVRSRDGAAASAFEIGTFFTMVVTLYGVYPLVGYWVNGGFYGPENDGRFYHYQPLPHEMAAIGWYYVGFLAAFLASYQVWRGRGSARVQAPPPLDASLLLTIVYAYVLILFFMAVLRFSFDLTAQTYAESYLVQKSMPLILQQLATQLGGARFTLEILVLLALARNYRRHRLLILAWILLVGCFSFLRLGSRTELALLIISALMVYDLTVKRISLRRFALAGAAGLGVFLLLGVLREGDVATQTARRNVFSVNNEFEVIFANVYDLREKQAEGLVEELGPEFYWSDFLALVPQQLLPVQKVSPSLWFINTFYPEYAVQGITFAFGVIAQSMVGAGWPEVLARGLALGLVFGLVHRWFSRRPPTVWSTAFYVYLAAQCYLSFRLTCFQFLALAFYRFLVPLLAIRILTALIGRVRRAPAASAG